MSKTHLLVEVVSIVTNFIDTGWLNVTVV